MKCESIKYDLKLSSLVFPSQTYYDNSLNTQSNRDNFKSIVKINLTIDSVRSNFVYFNIYYSSLKYNLLTESPKMSIADLISQIGGSLGLFVSFSIFTLFEFMEILILFIWGLFFEKKLNSVVQVSKN